VRARSLVKQARKPGKKETDRRPRTNPQIGTGIQRRPAADDRPNHPWIQYHPEPRQPPVDVGRQECSKQPRHLSERWPATRQHRLHGSRNSTSGHPCHSRSPIMLFWCTHRLDPGDTSWRSTVQCRVFQLSNAHPPCTSRRSSQAIAASSTRTPTWLSPRMFKTRRRTNT